MWNDCNTTVTTADCHIAGIDDNDDVECHHVDYCYTDNNYVSINSCVSDGSDHIVTITTRTKTTMMTPTILAMTGMMMIKMTATVIR